MLSTARFRKSITVFTFALLPMIAAAAAEVSSVDLGGKFGAFALNPETGDLAAIDPKASTITIFRSEFLSGQATEKIGPVKVGSASIAPVAITFKKYKARGIFAVVGRTEGSMYLFDAKDLSLIRKVPMTIKSINHMEGAPPADSPFIYYSSGDYNGALGRVNLARLVDEGTVGSGMSDFSVSASGAMLYGIDQSSPNTRCVRITEGKGGEGKPFVEVVTSGNRLGGTSVADPYEFHTAVGKNMMSVDLKTKVATLEFPVSTFCHRRPLIIGEVDGSVMIASYNSFELLARVELPKQLRQNDGDDDPDRRFGNFDRSAFSPQLFADDRHDRIIVAGATHVGVIPLKPLGFPEEPLLTAKVVGPTQLTIGRQAELVVSVADTRVKWEVESPLDGMKVSEKMLQWTPTAEQVGPNELQISLSHGELKKTLTVDLEVSHPYLKMPFWPAGLTASADGKHAVIWAGFVPQSGLPGALRPEDKTTHIAVLDLEKFSVVAEATLPFRAATAAIDNTFVYVAAEGNNYMQVFSLTDPTKRKQVVADDPIAVIEPVNEEMVLVGTQVGTTVCYTLPELKRISQKANGDDLRVAPRVMYPAFMERNDQGFSMPPLNLRNMQEGWMVDGLVYDAALSRIKLLAAPPTFFPIQSRSDTAEGGIVFRIPFDRQERRFGNRMNGLNNSTIVEHDRLPVRFTITVTYDQGRLLGDFHEQEETVTLTQADIVGETDREIITLSKSKPDPESMREIGHPIATPAGKGVLVSVQNKIFHYVPKTLDPAEYPNPIRFEQEQSVLVLDPKAATSLKHKLIGARKPVQYAAIQSRKELKLDASTGEIAVDGPGLVTAAVECLTSEPFAISSLAQMIPDRVDRSDKPIKILQDYLAASTPMFQRIAERKPTGIPFIVPVGLRAADADERIAELKYFLLVEVPLDELLKKFEVQQAARMNPAEGKVGGVEGIEEEMSGRGGVDERLEKLEQRIKALEGKLDLLTRLLSERLGKEGGEK